MSVQASIDRLNSIKERIRTNLVAQGITVPADTVLAEMAEQILSVAGKDGVSATHAWNGTVLTVTSASGTSSADLKGEQGVSVTSVAQTTTSNADGGTNVVTITLSNGQSFTVNIKNGSKGSAGSPGSTPQKGVDYFTAADKAEIAAAAAAEVDTSGLVPKTGATMQGALVAQTNANYTTRQMRNVIYLAEGASVPTTQNGDLVLFYK